MILSSLLKKVARMKRTPFIYRSVEFQLINPCRISGPIKIVATCRLAFGTPAVHIDKTVMAAHSKY